MNTIPELTIETIERFNLPVPRYTSYPTVPNWSESYGVAQHRQTLSSMPDKESPISLYIHIPFCERRCSFCGCNTYITRRESDFVPYVNSLKKEISMVHELIGDRTYSQFHIGGGTPSYLPHDLMDDLLSFVETKFQGVQKAEKSVEMHPGVVDDEKTEVFANHGFNRFSMGVQDFDPLVQQKINRNQTFQETKHLVEYSRSLGVESINIDLIYGLPYQTVEGFRKTIELINELKPERLAVYSYAHLPKVFKHQSIFDFEVIPQGQNKLQLFLLARKMLMEQGYMPIGFDHFSLKEDELWRAYRDGTLKRNFMGYSTKAGTDLVAFGFSAISDVNGAYAQNTKNLREYHELVGKGKLPVIKGLKLSDEDLMRREAISSWLCQFKIDLGQFRAKYGENFSALELEIQTGMERYKEEGLTSFSGDIWRATELGKIFARLPASTIDGYLKGKRKAMFSKSI